ncbi:MAG: hypothetical protein ACHQHO_02625 [Solirubrobacterales bacterium]
MNQPEARFSISAYKATVEGLCELGYELVPLRWILPEHRGPKPPAFMRHDVDVDITAALALAEVDASLNFAATFFISLQSPFFNPLSTGALRAMERLSGLGHEIAAHIDLRDLEGALAALHYLPRVIPAMRVDLVTVHCPPDDAPVIEVPGVENVQRRLDDFGYKYLSDSLGLWREGNPTQHPAALAGLPLHINTHPTWWVEPRQPRDLDQVPPRYAARTDTEWWFPKLTRKLAEERLVSNASDNAAEVSDA